jgi:serine/threonine-protein kinase
MTLKLRPDAGESHAALAEYLYWGHRDYERARAEVAIAKRGLPNDPLPLLLEAYMDRRQGRWNESTVELQHALAVDPHNINMLQQLAITYQKLRRYPDMVEALDRALALAPNDVAMRVQRAFVDLEWRADPKRLHATIETIVTQDPTAAQSFADLWVFLALCERDHIAADRAMAAMTSDGCYAEGVPFPRAWCAGVVARARGDAAAARTAFEEARNEALKTDREQPDYAEGYCVLGLIDAGLNRKEDAIREGRRAIELLPITRDAIDGALLVSYLSQIYAWTDEKDLAIEQLKMATQVPGGLSYGELRLHPNWDSLRGDSRFETIVASLAPTPPAH